MLGVFHLPIAIIGQAGRLAHESILPFGSCLA